MNKIVLGATALIAGVVMLAMSAAMGGGFVQAGGSPTATPDPTSTPDPTPCPSNTPDLSKMSAFGNGTTCPQPTQPPRSEEQDTPTPSATTAVTEVPETPGATNTALPPSTATPGGGAGAGGVSPPDTGSGPDSDTLNLSWVMLAGAALAMAGGATVVHGVRRSR